MPTSKKPVRVALHLRIPAAIDEKLTDLQQQTGLKRSTLVHLILTLVNRDVLATLLMDRDPHAAAQRLLASLQKETRR
jgi:hypothetical protein